MEDCLSEFLDENLATDTNCIFLNLEGVGCDNMSTVLVVLNSEWFIIFYFKFVLKYWLYLLNN